MRKYLLLLAAAAFVAAPRAAHAGYTATLGAPADTVLTPDSNNDNIANVGETFTVNSGAFGTYTPDTAADPQITAGDLVKYRYSLTGAASSVVANTVVYTGTYNIFYDNNLDTLDNDGLSVSSGNFSITAVFGGLQAALNGTLNQTAGPNNAAFADLGQYGPASFLGVYTATVVGQGANNQGLLSGVLTAPANAAAIPEPGSMALLATGLLPFAGVLRRRRK